ncbi:MAG TPA: EamA family transporter [Candidatus Sulfomarinibacteraceae bacterium]|nr:EamA family transporter [Candidatus Sulfomarinibacteraceae bacterium]
MTPPPRWKLILAFAAVYTIWGSTYLAIRFAVETLPPFLMSGVRFLIASAIMLAIARLQGAVWPTRRQWRGAAIVGVLLLFGGNGGVTWAEQYIPSGLTALLIASVPLWMVLMDWLRPGGVRPGARVFGGVFLGLVGLLLLVGPDTLTGSSGMYGAGILAVLLAAFSWAGGSIYGGRAELARAPLMGSGAQMLCGGLALTLGGLLLGEAPHVNLQAASTRSLLAVLYLIIFGSLAGYTAYSWLLQNAPPAKVATYAYVNPVVAVFLGWALAGETLNALMIAGAAITIAAVAIITTYRLRPRRRRKPSQQMAEIGD